MDFNWRLQHSRTLALIAACVQAVGILRSEQWLALAPGPIGADMAEITAGCKPPHQALRFAPAGKTRFNKAMMCQVGGTVIAAPQPSNLVNAKTEATPTLQASGPEP